MSDDEIKKECERLFQNGGPKVYFYDKNREFLRPSHSGMRRSALIADGSQDVYARCKNRTTKAYEWMRVTP